MRQSFKCIFAMIISVVLLIGCSVESEETNLSNNVSPQIPKKQIQYGELNLSEDDLKTVYAVRNGCVYGRRKDDDLSNYEFLKYDIASDTLNILGSVERFIAASGSNVLINEKLYFCYGYGDTLSDNCKSVLYELDTNTDTLSQRGVLKTFSPLVYVSGGSNGSVQLFANEIKEEMYKTKIVQFAPGQKKGKIIIEKECPLNFEYGEKILACDASENGDEIYLLSAEDDNGEKKIRIEVCDTYGQTLYTIPLAGEWIEHVLQQGIRSFSMEDGYLFIQNFSSEVVLAKHTGTELEYITMGDISCTLNRSEESGTPENRIQVFYERLGYLWFLDTENEQIMVVDICDIIECESVSMLNSVFVNEDEIFFKVKFPNEEVKMYIYQLSEIVTEIPGKTLSKQDFPILLFE